MNNIFKNKIMGYENCFLLCRMDHGQLGFDLDHLIVSSPDWRYWLCSHLEPEHWDQISSKSILALG